MCSKEFGFLFIYVVLRVRLLLLFVLECVRVLLGGGVYFCNEGCTTLFLFFGVFKSNPKFSLHSFVYSLKQYNIKKRKFVLHKVQ